MNTNSFTKIPNDLMSRTDLSAIDKLVYCRIVDFRPNTKDGLRFVQYHTLAPLLGVDKQVVYRSIKKLKRLGLLEVSQSTRGAKIRVIKNDDAGDQAISGNVCVIKFDDACVIKNDDAITQTINPDLKEFQNTILKGIPEGEYEREISPETHTLKEDDRQAASSFRVSQTNPKIQDAGDQASGEQTLRTIPLQQEFHSGNVGSGIQDLKSKQNSIQETDKPLANQPSLSMKSTVIVVDRQAATTLPVMPALPENPRSLSQEISNRNLSQQELKIKIAKDQISLAFA